MNNRAERIPICVSFFFFLINVERRVGADRTSRTWYHATDRASSLSRSMMDGTAYIYRQFSTFMCLDFFSLLSVNHLYVFFHSRNQWLFFCRHRSECSCLRSRNTEKKVRCSRRVVMHASYCSDTSADCHVLYLNTEYVPDPNGPNLAAAMPIRHVTSQ